MAGSIDRGPSSGFAAGDTERVRRCPARQRAVEPEPAFPACRTTPTRPTSRCAAKFRITPQSSHLAHHRNLPGELRSTQVIVRLVPATADHRGPLPRSAASALPRAWQRCCGCPLILTAVVGIIKRERLFDAVLNHWDETVAYAALFCLTHVWQRHSGVSRRVEAMTASSIRRAGPARQGAAGLATGVAAICDHVRTMLTGWRCWRSPTSLTRRVFTPQAGRPSDLPSGGASRSATPSTTRNIPIAPRRCNGTGSGAKANG